ncbi:MAG: CPBP family intramembrane glutamic endopeptidase [Myxococcota bacterium]|nr:CPBP family intramembrane glutamic endopeptidase [Myxococcota bacterium]
MQDPEFEPPSRASLVKTAGVFYSAMLAVAWAWAAWMGRSPWFASPGAMQRGVVPLDFAVGLVAGVLVIAVSAALAQTRWGRALSEALGSLLGPLRWRDCLVLALLSGVAEEAFFRGALQPEVGLFAASVIFGLAHLVPRRELAPWCLFSFAAGLLLGLLFDRTGNLVAPVVAHFVVNAVNLRLLSTRWSGGTG